MASVLKSSKSTSAVGSSSGSPGMSSFNLDDFAAAGARHLKAAEAEAARILAAARGEAEEIKKRAHAEGRSAGLAAAVKETESKIAAGVRREVESRMPILEETARQIGALEETFLEEFRTVLIGTSLAAAERMVRARLESEPTIVVRWAAEAVQAAKTARRLVIAVHPETMVAHGEALEQLLAAPGLPEDSRVEADESIEPAGVVVRREGGVVDLQLNQQLARLDELLRGTEY